MSLLASSLLDFADDFPPQCHVGHRMRSIETKREGTHLPRAALGEGSSGVACCTAALVTSTFFRQVDVDIEGAVLPALAELRFLHCLDLEHHHSVAGAHISIRATSLDERGADSVRPDRCCKLSVQQSGESPDVFT